MATVNFYSGSKSSFNQLGYYDPNGLYFITNGELFKGDKRIAYATIKVDELPQNDDAAQNIMYVLPNGEIHMYDGSDWHVLLEEVVNEIQEGTKEAAIPNVKAVIAEIKKQILNIPQTITPDDISLSKNEEGKLEIKGFSKATNNQQIRVVLDGYGKPYLEFFTPADITEVSEQVESLNQKVELLEQTINQSLDWHTL